MPLAVSGGPALASLVTAVLPVLFQPVPMLPTSRRRRASSSLFTIATAIAVGVVAPSAEIVAEPIAEGPAHVLLATPEGASSMGRARAALDTTRGRYLVAAVKNTRSASAPTTPRSYSPTPTAALFTPTCTAKPSTGS